MEKLLRAQKNYRLWALVNDSMKNITAFYIFILFIKLLTNSITAYEYVLICGATLITVLTLKMLKEYWYKAMMEEIMKDFKELISIQSENTISYKVKDRKSIAKNLLNVIITLYVEPNSEYLDKVFDEIEVKRHELEEVMNMKILVHYIGYTK